MHRFQLISTDKSEKIISTWHKQSETTRKRRSN